MARLLLAFALVSLLLPLRPAADEDPAAPVREAYKLERAVLAEARLKPAARVARPPWAAPHRDRLLSTRLARLFALDERYSQATGDQGNLELDPFLDAQDPPPGLLHDLVVDVTMRKYYHAEVRARFTGADGKAEIRFDLVLEDERWVIDDVRPRGWRWSAARALAEPYPCGARWNERCEKEPR